MAYECCHSTSNCSIIIPRLIYSGGDLAAGIIVTALLVAGISVAVHIAVFYLIYQKKLKPRMMLEATRQSSKDDDAGVTKTIPTGPLPVLTRNEAYGKVAYEK